MSHDPLAPLQVERNGTIVTLRFHRPDALNSIDVPMATALLATMRDIAQDLSLIHISEPTRPY